MERQESTCRKLAETKRWSDPTLYRDNDRSAASGKEHPEFERLLKDIEAGCIDADQHWTTRH